MKYLPILLCVGVFSIFRIREIRADDCGITRKCSKKDPQKYRTFDGTCNNYNCPSAGTPFSAYSRILPAKYGDNVSSLPKAEDGKDLPNPRTVRLTCMPDKLLPNYNLTRFLIGSLQFFAHDVSGIHLIYSAPNAGGCCTDDFQVPAYMPPYCASILIPPCDPYYSRCNMTCLPLVRTTTNFDFSCDESCLQAQQITTVTGYVDLSNVYGNSKEESDSLRMFSGGLLKLEERNGHLYLPNDPTGSTCSIPSSVNEVCYKSGDPKINQNADLTINGVIWCRLHNILSNGLALVNPCWNDQTLFDEARRITIAIHQRIVFYEIMPYILGRDNMCNNQVIFDTPYYVNDYDPISKMQVFNEYAHAAFKSIHSIIVGRLVMFDEKCQGYANISLRNHLGRPQLIEDFDNFDGLLRGMIQQKPLQFGPHFDYEVTNFLFLQKKAFGWDLPAFDIQRSRIHGLASYNDMRAYCKLTFATCFSDFSDAICPENIQKLEELYTSVNDVDLYVGGLLEEPAPGALIGPTFLCIILKQLKVLRNRDKYWYEHPEAGFTFEQLCEIRKTSVASLICDTSNNIQNVQLHAIEQPDELNLPISCDVIPTINLDKWKDDSCEKINTNK